MTDYKKILEDMGYKLSDKGSYWQTSAVYRNGDNQTAIQVYKDTGVWKDFVEDSIFKPFQALIEKTLNTKDSSLIKNLLKGSSNMRVSKKKDFLKEEKSYEKSCLKRLLPHYDFFTDRGISLETLKDYQCGLATSGKLYQRVVFPIFREDGKIHGFSGRKVIKDENKPKWLHNGKVSSWIYPFYTSPKTQNKILETKRVFLVESIGDSLSLYDKNVEENLVSFGLNPSPRLISRITSLNLEKIIFAFNNDFDKEKNRGLIGSIKGVFRILDFIDFEKIYICLPQKNDFGDMSQEDVNLYLKRVDSLSHKESCRFILDEARSLEKKSNETKDLKNKLPKAFSDSLKKFEKKYNFYYE